MTKKEAEEQYKEYLNGHIGNVVKALEVLATIDNEYVNSHIDELRDIVKDHDKTKWEEPEWSAYLHHFYPTNDEEASMGEEFDVAVKHHITNNKHHWNYWVDEDNNLKDDIDEEDYKLHTIERICDWLAMAAQHGEGPSSYWEANKEFVVQPDYARELCDEIFPNVPGDFNKDMWKVTRGELDESTVLPKNWKTHSEYWKDEKSFKRLDDILQARVKALPKGKVGSEEHKAQVNAQEDIIYARQRWDRVKKNLGEDSLPMNKKYVDSLGKRVRRSKTSNTIEIDTSMTNRDIQLGENIDENRITLLRLVDEAETRDLTRLFKYLAEIGYKLNSRKEIKDLILDRYGKEKRDSKNIEVAICNALHKDGEEYLTEMTASQIVQKSKNEDPERVARSKKVKSTYLGMSDFGILNFKTTSQSRSGHHYQTVEFKDMGYFEDIIKSGKDIMPDDIKKAIKEQDINVWCTDESFTYWAWGHLAYVNDFLYIDDRIPDLKKRIQAPKINNVRLNGGSCKHIISVLNYMIKPFVLLAISEDMNKYLAGTKEDKMNKQNVATQNQYDQVANWDWSDIEEYTGLSKAQILRDLSKTIQVVPSIDKGDALTDIIGEALPQEDQGLKRDIVDRAEELIEEE